MARLNEGKKEAAQRAGARAEPAGARAAEACWRRRSSGLAGARADRDFLFQNRSVFGLVLGGFLVSYSLYDCAKGLYI